MLSVRNLRRTFGDRLALDDVSFDVAQGSLLGFLGPNGSGKTTTMRIISGIADADSGTVEWNGAALSDAERQRVGYMPEERGLYPKMQLEEQIVFMARLHGLDRAAARSNVSEILERLGLGGRGTDRVDALSHGNQQRAQLAAALVGKPELLLLDEPYSGLDPAAVDEVAAVLSELARDGAAVLFSSHQLDLVERFCERVVIINAGRVVLSGDVSDLRRQHAGRRYRVAVRGMTAWANDLSDVTVEAVDGDIVTVSVGDAMSSTTLLDAARRAGTVDQFTPIQPTLTDLFRIAVAAA